MSLAENIKAYKDPSCTEEIKRDESGKPLIIVSKVVNAGETEALDIYLRNEFEHEFEVEGIDKADEDVSFELDQMTLYPHRAVRMHITFSPKPDRKKALNAYFGIKGRFIVRY